MRKLEHIRLVFILLLSGVISPQLTNAQIFEPKADFAPPLDIPLILAGNFGEIRSNHFHGGLDFKTNRQSGYEVKVVEKGYIYRIKVQPGGYGKAVYIKHPNGYNTVYGHLMGFRQDIENYVKLKQYQKESFSVDLFLGQNTFPLDKGEYFALSGNTGSSQAPHLHFEVRDSQTENPVNPLKFNFEVKDKTPPLLREIHLYSLEGRKDLKPKKIVRLIGSKGEFSPTRNEVYDLDEIAGIGVNTTDYLDEANNPCGVYQIEVFIDGELNSRMSIDEFAFSESKYINSLIDYAEYIDSRDHVIKTYIDPNNHLSIYDFAKNQGKIILNDTLNHVLSIRVKDVHGNASSAQLIVRKNPEAYHQYDYSKAFYSSYFTYAETNRFEASGFKLYIGPNSLYEDLYFKYDREDSDHNWYAPVHQIHNPRTPLHRPMTIWIEPDMPDRLKKYAVIARVNQQRLSSVGGKWDGNMLKTTTSRFGSYTVAIDTIPPTISPVNLGTAEVVNVSQDIILRIRDDFSGISNFRGTLDNKWILFEYDPKNALLIHRRDPKVFPAGVEKDLVVQVTDGVGNKSVYTQKVLRK